jgi:hypothetical protein
MGGREQSADNGPREFSVNSFGKGITSAGTPTTSAGAAV